MRYNVMMFVSHFYNKTGCKRITMAIVLQADQKRLLRQIGYLVLISGALAAVFSYKIDDLSFGAIFFSTCIFSLLFYPIFFLGSWIKTPPESFSVRAFLHLITLPSIIYYLFLSLFLLQYVFAAFSFDALCMTLAVFGVSIYLIYAYVQFVRTGW